MIILSTRLGYQNGRKERHKKTAPVKSGLKREKTMKMCEIKENMKIMVKSMYIRYGIKSSKKMLDTT